MPEQLTLFDVEIPQKVYRCDDCFCRWLNPLIECPLCHPDTSHATCEACQRHFEDSLYMLEHMSLGGRILCDICLPRVSVDDCRDQSRLRREAEEIRLDQKAFHERARKLRFIPPMTEVSE